MISWRPIKRFCLRGGEYGININSDSYQDHGVRLLRTTDIDEDGKLRNEDGAVYISAEHADGMLLSPRDMLFSRSGTLGRAYVHTNSSEPMTFAGYLVRFTPLETVDCRYIRYCSQASFFSDQISADAVVSTIANFNAERYSSIAVPWYRHHAQAAIADFLDVETARIGVLIGKKRRMIDLAREMANQSMPAILGEYGFNFPGEIAPDWRTVSAPVGWRVVRLSQVLVQLTNGYVGPTRDILVDSGVRYIQSLHIKDGEIDFGRRPFYVSHDWHSARPRIHLRADNVLIVQTGDIGKVAVVPEDFGPASCHALQIARVRRDMLSGAFLAEYLRTTFGYESLLSRATGALHPHLEGGIRDVPVILPPREVQSVILRQIGDERQHQKTLESRLVRQIELLQEHRQALITAAVTGEIDVPGTSA